MYCRMGTSLGRYLGLMYSSLALSSSAQGTFLASLHNSRNRLSGWISSNRQLTNHIRRSQTCQQAVSYISVSGGWSFPGSAAQDIHRCLSWIWSLGYFLFFWTCRHLGHPSVSPLKKCWQINVVLLMQNKLSPKDSVPHFAKSSIILYSCCDEPCSPSTHDRAKHAHDRAKQTRDFQSPLTSHDHEN